MRRALRTIERTLVRELAELKARGAMDGMLPRWDEAVGGDDYWLYELEFGRRLGGGGLYLWVPHAIAYLSRCRETGSRPEPDRLLQRLLP